MSHNVGVPQQTGDQHGTFVVTAQLLEKCCCSLPVVWIHEEGLDSRNLHTCFACIADFWYTVFCWDAPSYNKTFIEQFWFEGRQQSP